jgi:hypothetical protein
MKIAFHSNQLGIRGTEVAMFDYAKYNEEILGNESIIISKDPSISHFSHPLGVKRFKDRFTVYEYNEFSEIEAILDKENVDVFYAQKSGENDGIISSGRKTIIHAVFQNHDPHGDVYAYISEWLGSKFEEPFVPYIVDLPDVEGDLRKELNIPADSIVFGRHGGLTSFDIQFVHNTIKTILDQRNDIYFVFLHTNKFVDHENALFLDGNPDLIYKVKFINTCDAMIHARIQGESFGLAVAEFSLKNKPVITKYSGNIDNAHVVMLGSKGIYYDNETELYKILTDFVPDNSQDWNAYRDYTPEKVMTIFKNVFNI